MSRFLIAYSTTDGHTPRICARLQHVIEGQGHAVTVVPLADAEALDLNGFDRIVLGASIRYGPDTNPYLRKFLGQIAWKPTYLAVFAGKLDYPRYRPFDRFMIRLIMWMTKGPTDPNAVIEFTDWQQVEAFGRQVCEQV